MPQLYTRPRSRSFGERPLTQPSEADCRVGGGGAVEPRQRDPARATDDLGGARSRPQRPLHERGAGGAPQPGHQSRLSTTARGWQGTERRAGGMQAHAADEILNAMVKHRTPCRLSAQGTCQFKTVAIRGSYHLEKTATPLNS